MRLEDLSVPGMASEVITRLKQIETAFRQDETVVRRCKFFITEIMEDMLDRGGDFRVTDDYLDGITPPPHTGHVLT